MFRGLPVNTRIGHGHAVFQLTQIIRNLLIAGKEVAFQHNAANRPAAVDDLCDDVAQHEGLQVRILHAVGVRAVDNEARCDARFLQSLFGKHDAHRVKVRTSAAASENEVAVAIALSADDGTSAVFINTQEEMALTTRFDRIN